MSGLSLAVGPRTDPSAEPAAAGPSPSPSPAKQRSVVGGVMGSLRVIFSASGLVPLLDMAFPVLTSLYIVALSRLAFPSSSSSSSSSAAVHSPEIFQGSAMFRAYVVLGTTIGLFLPLAYVLGGFARGDDHAVRSATPHLFLLSFQILTENVISGLSLFSPPVRAMVPLIYTVRRISVTVDWIFDVWINKTLPANAPIKDVAWVWFGKVLALANLAYFSINLFGFLIPRFLPRAFERYFQERDETHFKQAEDKRAAAAAAASEQLPAEGKSEETKKDD